MQKKKSNRPGPPFFGGIGGRRHTTPNVTSLQMALARDDRGANNKTDAGRLDAYAKKFQKVANTASGYKNKPGEPAYGAYGFMKKPGVKHSASVPKWMA